VITEARDDVPVVTQQTIVSHHHLNKRKQKEYRTLNPNSGELKCGRTEMNFMMDTKNPILRTFYKQGS
jgi:phosphopantothenoylcysteine synthetase/decarboxylase